ncbi:hypothetical protein ACFSF2_06310 [Paenibacillus rhizophilus]|uniref:hypothetical protein n=1 Tax=Paenibacillus rhizophilus TaxID=1850366 RepID=UPI00363427D5
MKRIQGPVLLATALFLVPLATACGGSDLAASSSRERRPGRWEFHFLSSVRTESRPTSSPYGWRTAGADMSRRFTPPGLLLPEGISYGRRPFRLG